MTALFLLTGAFEYVKVFSVNTIDEWRDCVRYVKTDYTTFKKTGEKNE